MPAGRQWSPDLATGIDLIDSQHRHIFDLLAEVDAAILAADGGDIMDMVIHLLDYTARHNDLEERLMDQAGYPSLHEHKQSHREFLGTVENCMQQIAAGENPYRLARQISKDVRQWLAAHILYEDLAYVPWLSPQHERSRGVVGRLVGRLFGRHG